MNALPELPRSITGVEQLAESNLTMLEGRAGRRLRKPPVPRGDSGDMGATKQDDGSPVPTTDAQRGDSGNKVAGPTPRFILIRRRRGFVDGVYWIGVAHDKETGADIEKEPVWICSVLNVDAYTRDAQGNAWGRLLTWQDADGRKHVWAMPMAMLAGSGEELRAELLRQGLEIAQHADRRRMLGEYLQRERPTVTARCVERTGWHGDAFVLPTETIGDTAAEPIIFQTAAPDGITLGCAGTLKGWRENVAAPCAGNSRLVLALSVGFAGLCIGLIGTEGGGIHLKGASSAGKTTGLALAASMFGLPSFARTWRQTDNALEGVASLHSDLLLILDEIGQLDPKHAGAVAYLLANGQGKGRARRDGSPRAAAAFRLLFLSAGEIGLGDLVTAGGGKQRAGMDVRVIDVPADAGTGHGMFDLVPDGIPAGAFAERLKAAAATHYGHAMPAFLRAVVADVAAKRIDLREMRDKLANGMVGPDDSGQVRRVAQRFALIAAAGELATTFGLTGWLPQEAERAARRCFADWLGARGTTGQAEPAAMLAQVRAFLGAHGESRFSAWVPDERERVTINRAGFRRESTDGPEFFVETEAFRREVCLGFDYQQVAIALRDRGALMPESASRLTRKERLPDCRNARVYRITPAIWEDGQ